MSKTTYVADRFDRLEQQLYKSFRSIDQRFEKVDQKFEKIDRKFEKIDQKFESIDRRFEKIDRRFEKIDQKFEKVGQQLDKLTMAMIKGFGRIDKELDKKANKVDLNRALDMLDTMIKRQEIDHQERLVTNYQLERHERWLHELADQSGHKLSSA